MFHPCIFVSAYSCKLCVFLCRCLVDSGFGHIRKLFRRSDVDAFSQLVDVVQKSASSNVAIPYQDDCGKTWEWRDWKQFLSSNFKAVRNIRKYHHFMFSCKDPGYVFLKESVDSVETKVSIYRYAITDPQARAREYRAIASCICIEMSAHTSDHSIRTTYAHPQLKNESVHHH